jgi:hypothetical protein
MGNTYALIPSYGNMDRVWKAVEALSEKVGCREVVPLILYEDENVGMATGFTAAANTLFRSALADPNLHGVYMLCDDVVIETENFHHIILADLQKAESMGQKLGAIMPMELLPGATETLLPAGGGSRPLDTKVQEEIVYPMLAFAWISGEALRKMVYDHPSGTVLDEQFSPGIADDFDLGVRLWLAGYTVMWEPAIQFRHWDRGQTMSKVHTMNPSENLRRLYAKYPFLHFGQDTKEVIKILKIGYEADKYLYGKQDVKHNSD